MSTYTYTYPEDALLTAGKPARAVDIRSIRDIGPAIAEGADDAPRVTDAALDTTVTADGVSWVGLRSVQGAAGAIGTVAFLARYFNGTIAAISFGDSYQGSLLRPAGTGGTGTTTMSGTWRCLGQIPAQTSSGYSSNATLFVRIA